MNTRRDFLMHSTLALGGAALLRGAEGEPARFTHRALNGWITDLATAPEPHAPWPSIRLDEKLLADYREMFALMQRLGFSEIVIWGLYVAGNWPVDLASSITAERAALVTRLIADAHAHGIKVLSGLGTYSWGFEELRLKLPDSPRVGRVAACLQAVAKDLGQS